MKLQLISEIAFNQGAEPRPIHMLRAGTFTDMHGTTVTFTRDDIAAIAARYSGARKAPINEGHDFGRAVGRIQRVWSDGENLFGLPSWNKYGKELLAEQVYDGFSIELNPVESSWALIGGALTNYPAVDGLTPVALAAPPAGIDGHEAPARVGAPQETRMSEQETGTTVELSADMRAAVTALASEQATALLAQARQEFAAQLERERQAFAAQLAAERTQQEVRAFAQHITTPTVERKHALPFRADEVAAFMSNLDAGQRQAFSALMSRVLENGLVSFEELGAMGEENTRGAVEAWESAITSKTALGLSRSAAITALMSEQPTLYAEYNAAKKGGR